MKLCPENERTAYLAIFNGEQLIYNIGLYSTDSLEYLIGYGDKTSFKGNFSEEMAFLKEDEKLYLVYFATALPLLKSFLLNNKNYVIDIDNLLLMSTSIKELKVFLRKNNGRIPQSDAEKLSHLKNFIKLSLFSITEIKKKISAISDDNAEKKFWKDCIMKAEGTNTEIIVPTSKIVTNK